MGWGGQMDWILLSRESKQTGYSGTVDRSLYALRMVKQISELLADCGFIGLHIDIQTGE